MAAHNKTTVLATLHADGIVPVFHHTSPDITRTIAQRVVAGGLHIIEFAMRSDDALAIVADLLSWSRSALPELIVGAGTVLQPSTACHLLDLGANFVFAPNFSPDVAQVCNERNVAYVPGCATVTEIQTAYRAGCDVVKLFPANSLGGPRFLADITAACPWINAIPTGGVEPTTESLRSWFDAGAHAVGLGSKLFPKNLSQPTDAAAAQHHIADAVAAVADARRKE